jgi:uncharacterized protein (DUF1501 family)
MVKTLLQQYNNERTTIAFTDEENTRIIDVVNQPCEQFAIHPDFAIAENLYNNGCLAFFANIGQLDTPVTKDDYYSSTRTELCAHHTMQHISQRIDPWDEAAGTGILGRFSDILSSKGYNVQPITIAKATAATVGNPGQGWDPLIMPSRGLSEFAPRPENEAFDIKKFIPLLNNATDIHSSTANSGTGSDHAWGGNLFALGGSIRGKQILGEYPADINSPSTLNVDRGRLIPTLIMGEHVSRCLPNGWE